MGALGTSRAGATTMVTPWRHFGDTPGTGTQGTGTPEDTLGSVDVGTP